MRSCAGVGDGVASRRGPKMSTERDASPDGAEARADGRWLIGIGITLIFGIFGAVMAVLSYSNKANDRDPPAAPAAVAPATVAPGAVAPGGGEAPASPAPRGHGKGKKHD